MPITVRCNDCFHEEEFESEQAAERDGWKKINGNWYDHGHWFYCDDCDEAFPSMLRCVIERLDEEVCEHCLMRNYQRCDHCGEWDYKENMTDVQIEDENQHYLSTESWCDNCRDNEDENLEYSDEGEAIYTIYGDTNNLRRVNMEQHYHPEKWAEMSSCIDCREYPNGRCPKHLQLMAKEMMEDMTHTWVWDKYPRGYHEQSHFDFKRLKLKMPHENPYLYYGAELEVLFKSSQDLDVIVREAIEASEGLFVAEYDRSVADLGNGTEFITRPMSYKMWMSDEVRRKLEKFITVLNKYHACNPQPEGCGLHVHMSKKFFENNTKKKVKQIKSDIDWIFQIFQDEIEKISRRPYTEYCASKKYRLSQSWERFKISENMSLNAELAIKPSGLTQSRGSGITHHDAIIETGETIEVRTFRSTINIDEILATIEFCRAIAHSARNMKFSKNTTLEDVMFYKDCKFLPFYIKRKGIDLTKKFNDKVEVKL